MLTNTERMKTKGGKRKIGNVDDVDKDCEDCDDLDLEDLQDLDRGYQR